MFCYNTCAYKLQHNNYILPGPGEDNIRNKRFTTNLSELYDLRDEPC